MSEVPYSLIHDQMKKHDTQAAFDLIDRIKKDGTQYLGTEGFY